MPTSFSFTSMTRELEAQFNRSEVRYSYVGTNVCSSLIVAANGFEASFVDERSREKAK